MALPKSVFSDNIELYFKISDEEGTPEYIALVKTALALIKDSGLPESQEVNTTGAGETHSEDALVIKEKNAELQAIVEQLRQEIAIEIASHGETREALANATATKIAMQSDLDMVIAQNTALTDKTQLMQAELDRFYQLSRYADTESEDTYSTARNLKGVKGEEIDNVDLFVDELADNLNAIGYEGVSATHMARTVAFCIGNRLPIICGANAVKIADCIAAMFGDNGAYTATLAMNQSDCRDLCESIRTASTDKTSVIVVDKVQ